MFHRSPTLPARLHPLARDVSDPRAARGLVRAGALTELARHGLPVDDDGIATPADPDSGTGDGRPRRGPGTRP